jgi:hypothetical protein
MKTYLVIGISGSGKSTICNILRNKNGNIEELEMPFGTSNQSRRCTIRHQIEFKDNDCIIDTIGFDQNDFLKDLEEALNEVDNTVTSIIYVFQFQRNYYKENKEFINWLSGKNLFNNDLYRKNSFLVVNRCDNGWIDQQIPGLDNDHIKTMMNICDSKYFELDLRMDRYDDTDEDKSRNYEKRQERIDQFINWLDKYESNNNAVTLKIEKCCLYRCLRFLKAIFCFCFISCVSIVGLLFSKRIKPSE